jgi:hypothetical protein
VLHYLGLGRRVVARPKAPQHTASTDVVDVGAAAGTDERAGGVGDRHGLHVSAQARPRLVPELMQLDRVWHNRCAASCLLAGQRRRK